MMRVTTAPAAERDLEDIVDHYPAEAGVEVATHFPTRWHRCTSHISQFPTTGSLRLSSEAGIDGLRIWQIRGFQYAVLYREAADRITVLRVLHTSRDLKSRIEI